MAVQIQFVELSLAAAAIQTIRYQVFHLEQGIPLALEWDGQDEAATHVLAYWQQQAVGTARLRSLSTGSVKIERVAVLTDYRGRGIGRQIILAALAWLQHQEVQQAIIHAQQPTQSFYEKLGFTVAGPPFLEAGLAHVKMVRPLTGSDAAQ